MQLPVEIRFNVVAVDNRSVTVRPEIWYGNQCMQRQQPRTIQLGEVMTFGPVFTEVEFEPPVR